MITLSLSVTGGELGRELANDPEELVYALQTLEEWKSAKELGKEMAEVLGTAEAHELAEFLRALARHVDSAEED